MADDPNSTIVPFPNPHKSGSPYRSLDMLSRAELWEGLVRVMEANGRTKIEIGLEQAKDVAAMARELAR